MTRIQFETLLSELVELKNDELKFHAIINGVDLDKDEPAAEKESSNQELKVPLFSDPEEYFKLSDEEKQSMTENMKNKHQLWSSDKKA